MGWHEVAHKFIQSVVLQTPKLTPRTFLERLIEAYKIYIPLDLEAPKNWSVVSMAFANQSAPDICRKLQGLKGFKGKRLAKFIAVAEKVLNNRETPPNRQTKGLIKALKRQTWGLTKVILAV